MAEITLEEKQKRIEEAKASTQYILSEVQVQERNLAVNTAKEVMKKFEKIEQKERCLRVKFLDWLSDKLLDYSKRVHQMSVRIDSPCVIKLPEIKQGK